MESSVESFQFNRFSTNCSQNLMGNIMCQDLRELYGEKGDRENPKGSYQAVLWNLQILQTLWMTGLHSPQLGGLSPGHPSEIHNDGITFLSFLILTHMFPKISLQVRITIAVLSG